MNTARNRIDWIKFLSMRSKYEFLIRNMSKVPEKYRQGVPSSMTWFLKNGGKANRFRKSYPTLVDACQRGLLSINGTN